MWRVDGFKTKEEANAFRKEHGGIVLWDERTPKRKQLTSVGKEYQIAMQATGLSREVNPYIVERRV